MLTANESGETDLVNRVDVLDQAEICSPEDAAFLQSSAVKAGIYLVLCEF